MTQKELIEHIIKEFGIEVTLPLVEDIAENEKTCPFTEVARQTGTKETGKDHNRFSVAPYQLLTVNEQNETVLYSDSSNELKKCNLIRPIIKINKYFELFIQAFPTPYENRVIISRFPIICDMPNNFEYDYPTGHTYTFFDDKGNLILCSEYNWSHEYLSYDYSRTTKGTCINIPTDYGEVVADIKPLHWTVDNERKEITSVLGLYSGDGFSLSENEGNFKQTKLYDFLNNTVLRELFQTIPIKILDDLSSKLEKEKQEEVKR